MSSLSRRVFTWKFYFYEVLLPSLRHLGPARADRAIAAMGRLGARLRPGRRAALREAARRINAELKRDGDPPTDWRTLAESAARFTARDYALNAADDALISARFDVTGLEAVEAAMARGGGAILVGSHFGAHVAGMHWLFRFGPPARALVQRPKHVSAALSELFDRAGDGYAQSDFFLRSNQSPSTAVERMLQARSALRDGLALYLNGDVVWDGANTRVCRLLGLEHPFLAIWTDLAAITRAPVFFVFCKHLPGGRFALDFEPLDELARGQADRALSAYMRAVEARVAADPAEAIAYLTWPCYTTPSAPAEPPNHQRRAMRLSHIATREGGPMGRVGGAGARSGRVGRISREDEAPAEPLA